MCEFTSCSNEVSQSLAGLRGLPEVDFLDAECGEPYGHLAVPHSLVGHVDDVADVLLRPRSPRPMELRNLNILLKYQFVRILVRLGVVDVE